MHMNFDTWCKELHLNPEHGDAAQLQILENWCHQHVSSDITYSGDRKYQKYLSLAKHYLEEPPTNTPEGIQDAAYKGYDYFLKSLNLSPEAWSAANEYGMTALHKAAVAGHLHTVVFLLEQGAEPRKENNNGQFPIGMSLLVPIMHEFDVLAKKEAIVQLLMNKAPDTLTHQDQSGDSILHLMATFGFPNLAKQLLEQDSKLAFVPNNVNVYPVHSAILNNQIEMLRLLLTQDKVAELKDSKGHRPFHYAARYANKDILQLCFEQTTDINARDTELRTPLMLAAEAGNEEAILFLIKHKADVTLIDGNKFSALHYAVRADNEPMVRLFLEHLKAEDLSKMDPDHTLVELADGSKIQKLLLEHGAKKAD